MDVPRLWEWLFALASVLVALCLFRNLCYGSIVCGMLILVDAYLVAPTKLGDRLWTHLFPSYRNEAKETDKQYLVTLGVLFVLLFLDAVLPVYFLWFVSD